MAELRSIKIPGDLYEVVKNKAVADRRTLTATLEMMIYGIGLGDKHRNDIIDGWLDMTALNEVQRRWHSVTAAKKGVRVDGR
jgi:hypothetical protein